MPTLTLASGDPASTKADVVLIAALKGAKGPQPVGDLGSLDKALRGKLAAGLAGAGFTGAEGESTRVATFGATTASSLLAVGLGEAAGLTAEKVRRAVGAAVRGAAGTNRLAIVVPTISGLSADEALRAVLEGAQLGAYDFTKHKQDSLTGRKAPVASVVVLTPDAKSKDAKRTLERSQTVISAVHLVRDLVNTSPGHLHPADLAAAAVAECGGAGCSVDVMDEKALRKGGYGGIVGVGQGSVNPPRLVRIGWNPKGAKRHVALVGKGITFDSGGLSIKPAVAMEWMKIDMAGAAAVIATLRAVAQLKLPVKVTGWVPTAENMPSGTAIRPGDVLTMYSGKRVEVLNTDAEGRLVLADALWRAGEESPDWILDVATLTGAQVVALGTKVFAVMANDDDLRTRVCDAAGRAGELAWPMPLPPELRKGLDSEVADLSNMGDRSGGGMLSAGLFLKEFVREGTPWTHLDIAGPSYNEGAPWGYNPKGGTGVAVRTMVELIEAEASR